MPGEAAPGPALRAGAITTTWRDGRLGPLAIEGHEVWHGVHFLLRDPHWRTPGWRLGPPRVGMMPDVPGGWRLVAEGWCGTDESVRLRLTVEGMDEDGAAGRLMVAGEVRVERDIEVNRLGLCLLHPLSAAGRALEIGHDDGRLTRSSFPRLVPAWPPFGAIRSLRHEYTPGAWAEAEFDGDVFELEDQRNNADASFKTYSRSNFMPRPFRLRAGEVLRQRVILKADRPAMPAPKALAVFGWPRREPGDQPAARLGVAVTADDLEAAARSLTRGAAALAALRPDHLHVSLPGRNAVPDLRPLAGLLGAAGAQAGLRLDMIDLPAEGAAERLAMLRRHAREAGLGPWLDEAAGAPPDVAVFPTTAEAVRAARDLFPCARIGGGTSDFFVQLNRAERLPPLDFLAFTVCPIVHAADDETVMLSHASLAGMMATLRARFPGLPVHLGPSMIAARRSPLGQLAPAGGARPVPLAGSDPRDGGPFGAAWVAAHLSAALAAGVRVLTVSRLSHCDAGSPTGMLLGRLGARCRPAGLAAVGRGADGALLGLQVATPAGEEAIWVNTAAEPQALVVPPGCEVRWRSGPGAQPASMRPRAERGSVMLEPCEMLVLGRGG